MKKFFKSSKLNNHIICYDLETGSADPYTAEPLEICAIVYDINTLEPKDVEPFYALVKPPDWSLVQAGALAKNKLTKEKVEEEGVDQKIMFEQFANYCLQFTRSDKKWDALIPAGFNIMGFDNIIMDRLCTKYGYVDNKNDGKLFHPFHSFDLFPVLRMWFHNGDQLSGYSLDDVREYFGISKEGAHKATKDVQDTWLVLCRFIKMYREMSPKKLPSMRRCFAEKV